MPYKMSTTQEVRVSGEELVALVQSTGFRSRLARAARITTRTGHESGFRVYRHRGGRTQFTPAYEGSCDAFGEQFRDWEERNLSKRSAKGGLYLIDLHLHPQERGPPRPSLDDMVALNGVDPYHRPLVAVGNVITEHIEMLFMQKTFSGYLTVNNEIGLEAYEQLNGHSSDGMDERIQSASFVKYCFTAFALDGDLRSNTATCLLAFGYPCPNRQDLSKGEVRARSRLRRISY